MVRSDHLRVVTWEAVKYLGDLSKRKKNVTKIDVNVPFSTSSLAMPCCGLLSAISSVVLSRVCHIATHGVQCVCECNSCETIFYFQLRL